MGKSKAARRLLWGGACVVAGLVGFTAWAIKPAIAPVTPPAPISFDTTEIQRGEKLAAAGYCVTCHTAAGGKPFAGGLPMVTGFGTIYTTNITPDAATGIGSWSLAAFTRAMHEGVARDGSHLFPAFPYDRFTKTSNEDVKALYAYLMSQPAVSQAPKAPDMPFPLNVRLLQAGWKLLFFKEGRYEPVTTQTAEWNRGAYLAEGLAHCASCHTPRNALGAEKTGDARYAGAVVDGWFAPALNASNNSPVPWNADELYSYLRKGGTAYHGVAAGPMSHVVYQGMALVDDSDVHAVAHYFASMNGSASRNVDVAQVVAGALARSRFDASQTVERGANVYAAACAACHYNALSGPQAARPELGLKSSLSAADPTNLVNVILHGVSLKEGLPEAMMPAFGTALTNDDIAALVTYLRKTRTDLPPWQGVAQLVAKQRDDAKKN
ncbi:cytochrome c [Variovorax ginsengisoli]|uniref:Mono/diheme cytochrome c family protein n=1 Tax=Variovorax ginsengisoli TaxID=363844 RepID=A0ABT9S1T7_9BURK|nr:cytochrome c [Variovorax ginsengisoli]MDP9898313.1 mono/diheme cytochrome c family protein [Variovorax ginsengisoli]